MGGDNLPLTPVLNQDLGRCYSSIQLAIDASETVDGHTLLVSAGEYYENVDASKQLTIIGAGVGVTTVNAFDPGHDVFAVSADNVNVCGFTLKGATAALKAGVQFLNNSHVHSLLIDERYVKGVKVKQDNRIKEFKSKIVIDAEGVLSSVLKHSGISTLNSRLSVQGVQAEASNIEGMQEDTVEIYLGYNFAPGFFAWIVPTGNNTAKVGLGIPLNMSQSAFKFLDAFMQKHPIAQEKFRECRVLRQTAHVIPVGGTLNRTTSDGILVVGDAARQVKSTTGGGLYYGMACAQIAGDAVSRALKTCNDGVLKRKQLVVYENQWRKKFGKEINFSVKARAFLDSLSEPEVNYLFDLIRREESLIKRIEMDGDIDYQSKIILSLVKYTRSLIKKPKLVYKLIRFFPLLKLK